MTRAWSFLTLKEDERQFSGNIGYEDEVERYYSFDATVPNHGAVAVGDLAVLRDSEYFLGFGWIDDIESWVGEKHRFRCPDCGRTGFKMRRRLVPRYRCQCGETFDDPVVERLSDLRMYRARYQRTWRPLDTPLTTSSMQHAYRSRATQHAIRELDMEAWIAAAEHANGYGGVIWDLGRHGSTELTGGHAVRQAKVRLGQQAFRDVLQARYGWMCAITGPSHPACLEAAHLYRYSESPVHDPSGGLLLRRDLHALFDRFLLAIDPEAWQVRVAPQLGGYGQLWSMNGAPLRVPPSLRPEVNYVSDHFVIAKATWL